MHEGPEATALWLHWQVCDRLEKYQLASEISAQNELYTSENNEGIAQFTNSETAKEFYSLIHCFRPSRVIISDSILDSELFCFLVYYYIQRQKNVTVLIENLFNITMNVKYVLTAWKK